MFGFGVSFKKKGNSISFYGNFGTLRFNIERTLKTKTKYLFKTFKMNELEINNFFVLELYSVLRWMKENNKHQPTGILDRMFGTRDLDNIIKILEEETNIHDMLKSTDVHIPEVLNMKALDKFVYKPLPHQQAVFDNYLMMKHRAKLRGSLIKSYVGSGKTYMSLVLTEMLGANVKIIISPKNAIYKVWKHSLTTELYKESITPYILDEGKPYNHEEYIVCHYEALQKLLDLVPKIPHGKRAIIIDESHNFARAVSDRTNLLIDLVDAIQPDDVIPMSGTPNKGKAIELHTLYYLLDPTYNRFIARRYLKLYNRPHVSYAHLAPERFALLTMTIKKTENSLPPLHELDIDLTVPNEKRFYLSTIREDMRKYIKEREKELRPLMGHYKESYKILREQAYHKALKDSKTTVSEYNQYVQWVEVIVDAYNKNALKDVSDELIWVNTYERKVLLPALDPADRKEFRTVKTLYKYPSLKLLGEALGKIVVRARIECFKEMAKQIDYRHYIGMTSKKVIAFSKYVEVAQTVNDLNPDYSLNVYGDKAKNLTPIVTEFKENKNKLLMIATYKSLSTAVPLVMANVILMVDPPFKDYEYDQARGRVWRTGQDTECFIIRFKLNTGANENISTRNKELMELNAKDIAYITGKSLPLNSDDSDVNLEDYDIDTEIVGNIKQRMSNVYDW